jgi:hypothetical protein
MGESRKMSLMFPSCDFCFDRPGNMRITCECCGDITNLCHVCNKAALAEGRYSDIVRIAQLASGLLNGGWCRIDRDRWQSPTGEEIAGTENAARIAREGIFPAAPGKLS